VGDAAKIIARCDADVMIAGGTEAAITPLGVGGFASMRALSTRNDEPERASRPWDKDRDGFVIGEGATTQVGYINAHGTSTDIGDKLETVAIKRAFGEHAHNLSVSSTKSMTGHVLGGAGALEAAITALALRDQVLPPTINLENPDEGCDLDYVPNRARPKQVEFAMSNSFGFGGTNGCLLLRRWKE
jgi:3-oxoacyl-[acyl-carrier-protein] synthase II